MELHTDTPSLGRLLDEPQCRVCEGPVGRRGTTICGACDRYRLRHGGLTECCGVLRMTVDGATFCPACPGPGRVPVILVHEGRERTAYYPPSARVSTTTEKQLTLAELARRRAVRPSELVLEAADARSWGIRRLRVRLKAFVRRRVTFVCLGCNKVTTKVTGANRKSAQRCDPCREQRRKEVRLKSTQRYFTQQKEAGIRCDFCQQVCTRFFGLRQDECLCSECYRRVRVNGRCAKCAAPLSRVNASQGRGTYCPVCGPVPRHRGIAVTVTLIDGDGNMSTVKVSATSDLGVRRFAGGWWGPLVYVDRLPPPGYVPGLRNAPVIGGVYVRGTGPTVRLALGLIARAGVRSRDEARELIRRELGTGDVGPAILGLLRAGLLDNNGLTDRARALVRWAEAAGVPL